MVIRKPTIAALMTAALALALGALPAHAQEKMKLRLVFSTTITTTMVPYLYPKDTGWFDKQGLNIEETIVTGDANALRAVLGGSGDVTIIGPEILFKAVIEGAKLKSIGSWQPRADYEIVAAKPLATLQDLTGKIFASAGLSGSTTEYPKMVLKKHGLDPSTITFVQVGGHPARLQAVAGGKAQATMINALTTVKGQKEGVINVISKVSDDFPSLGYSLLVAQDSDLANPAKRKALEILIEGGILGARYAMDHPDDAAELLAKRAPEIGIDIVKPVIHELDAMHVWGVNGGNEPDVIAFSAKVSKDLGAISREVTMAEVVDDSLAQKALAKLGKR